MNEKKSACMFWGWSALGGGGVTMRAQERDMHHLHPGCAPACTTTVFCVQQRGRLLMPCGEASLPKQARRHSRRCAHQPSR